MRGKEASRGKEKQQDGMMNCLLNSYLLNLFNASALNVRQQQLECMPTNKDPYIRITGISV